jgi:ABC-type dipeptide/oligopeptide/nickel transport system permease subunit
MRGKVMAVKVENYVEAARAAWQGPSSRSLICKHYCGRSMAPA